MFGKNIVGLFAFHFKKSEITLEVGGWVSLGEIKENRHKIVLYLLC